MVSEVKKKKKRSTYLKINKFERISVCLSFSRLVCYEHLYDRVCNWFQKYFSFAWIYFSGSFVSIIGRIFFFLCQLKVLKQVHAIFQKRLTFPFHSGADYTLCNILSISSLTSGFFSLLLLAFLYLCELYARRVTY